MSYRIINGKAYGAYNIDNLNSNTAENKKNIKSKGELSFLDILNEKINEKNYSFKISKHASDRLNTLGFNDSDYKKIDDGIEKARLRGSKNTVIIYKDVSIVASVENNTIITAVDKNRSDDNVFTNIDSAVIL